MLSTSEYSSPLGKVLLAADEAGLCGLWFEGQKYFPSNLEKERKGEPLPVFTEAKRWLNIYFSGREPDFKVPLHVAGSLFQKDVWELLLAIPYGTTTTYGQLAERLAEKRKISRMSAQAVGGAVGKNPISILIPCHRVVGKDGSFTGYAGGIHRKNELLKLEGALKDEFFIPKRSTAP